MKFDWKKFCLAAGCLLLIGGGLLMLRWQWNIRTYRAQAARYAQTLEALIPEPQAFLPEERFDNTMPVLALEGTDFIGLLEMPRYGSLLPVCGQWGSPDRYPCRFSGSLYDRSLVIGATSQQGQYDFYREISVGDQIRFTDATGNRCAFTVSHLRYTDHADQAALSDREADLVLFIKNVYALEYIILFCSLPA